MPTSDTLMQRRKALALFKRRGMTRLAEFGEAGITATTVSRMSMPARLRLARGLYQLPDAALDPQQSLAEAARLVPGGNLPRFGAGFPRPDRPDAAEGLDRHWPQ